MFNVSEGYNLNPTPEPSIIDKLAAMDIDIRKLRVKHQSSLSSYYSDSTSSHSYRFAEKKAKSRHYGGQHATDFFSEMPSQRMNQSKISLKSGGKQPSEMSLEEKILNGFYK
jgi:hypothetical protein